MKPFAMLRLFSLILFGIRYTTSSDNPNLLFLCRKIHLPEWSTQRTFTKGFFEQIFSNLQYTNEPQQDGKTASRHTQTRTRTRTRTHTHTHTQTHTNSHTCRYITAGTISARQRLWQRQQQPLGPLAPDHCLVLLLGMVGRLKHMIQETHTHFVSHA
jgi:hypothetical protein